MTIEVHPARAAYDAAVEAAAEAAAALCEVEEAMQRARERYDLMRHRVCDARRAMKLAGCTDFREDYDSKPRYQPGTRGDRIRLRRLAEADEDDTTD